MAISASFLDTIGQLATWFNWGIDARIEFAVVTIVLALLLFAKEIISTSHIGGTRLSRALTVVIVPLLVLFFINLAAVFLL